MHIECMCKVNMKLPFKLLIGEKYCRFEKRRIKERIETYEARKEISFFSSP